MAKFHYSDHCDQVLYRKNGYLVCNFFLLKTWSQTWSQTFFARELVEDQVGVMEFGHYSITNINKKVIVRYEH